MLISQTANRTHSITLSQEKAYPSYVLITEQSWALILTSDCMAFSLCFHQSSLGRQPQRCHNSTSVDIRYLKRLQVAIFAFAVWAGSDSGGVIAGLAVAGFVMAATSSAGTLMQARI